MKEKVLMIATVPSMIGQFNMNNINILINMDYDVHVACDWKDRSVWTGEKINDLKIKLDSLNVKYFQIDYSRSMFNIKNHYNSYKQTLKLLKDNHYKFIHCHTPIASAIARLACKKTKTKCIYTAHGFHFFEGAPLKNWIIFYPIEKWLSKYTDVLVTINKEDYQRAEAKFHMKRLEYVPGVGVDVEKFQLKDFDRDGYRKQLGFNIDDFVICSVGELNKNKNHEVVIRAIAKLNNPKIKYMIAGQGELKQYLIDLSKELKVDNQLFLLGFRKDIPELLNSADLYVLPSLREGLNVSLMEAMSSGLPCLASKIRGNVDLIDYKSIFLCNSIAVDDFSNKIDYLYNDKEYLYKEGEKNKNNSINYDFCNICQLMYKIYKDRGMVL